MVLIAFSEASQALDFSLVNIFAVQASWFGSCGPRIALGLLIDVLSQFWGLIIVLGVNFLSFWIYALLLGLARGRLFLRRGLILFHRVGVRHLRAVYGRHIFILSHILRVFLCFNAVFMQNLWLGCIRVTVFFLTLLMIGWLHPHRVHMSFSNARDSSGLKNLLRGIFGVTWDTTWNFQSDFVRTRCSTQILLTIFHQFGVCFVRVSCARWTMVLFEILLLAGIIRRHVGGASTMVMEPATFANRLTECLTTNWYLMVKAISMRGSGG